MLRSRMNPLATMFLTLTCLAGGATSAHAQQEFARTTIDLGCVVSDVDAATRFYKQAIGFKEVEGFHVPEGFATRAGLTDQQPLSIRVLMLGEDETATKLKLMEVPGVKSKPSDNATIPSQLGFSYLTIYVADMDAVEARLNEAGVEILGEGPVELPEDLGAGIYLAVVRDPDGNLIELVGPRKQ